MTKYSSSHVVFFSKGFPVKCNVASLGSRRGRSTGTTPILLSLRFNDVRLVQFRMTPISLIVLFVADNLSSFGKFSITSGTISNLLLSNVRVCRFDSLEKLLGSSLIEFFERSRDYGVTNG